MSAPIPVFGERPKAVATPKLRALVRYPGNIVGGTGIDVTKEQGTVTIDMAWNEFGQQSAVPTSPTNNVLTFDTATGVYVMVPSSLLGGATSGIADAPIDGIQYGRQSGSWTAIATGAAGGFAADKRIFVSTSGNDSNGGLSTATAKATIQAALNTASGGGVVDVGVGTFSLATALLMTPGVQLKLSPGTVITQNNNANLNPLINFSTNSADAASIVGGTIDGNRAHSTESTGALVAIGTASNVRLDHVILQNGSGDGVAVSTGQLPKIYGCTFSNICQTCVLLSPGSGGALTYARVIGNDFIAPLGSHAIAIVNSHDNVVAQNKILASQIGNIASPMTVSSSGTTVTWASGPDFTNVTPGMFLIANGGNEYFITAKASSTSLTVSLAPSPALSGSLALIGTGDVIGIDGSSECEISDNYLHGGAVNGIVISNTSGGAAARRNRIRGNQLYYQGSCALSIQLNPANSPVGETSFVNNLIYNCNQTGTAGLTGAFKAGITIINACVKTSVIGNTVIDDQGTKTSDYWLGLGGSGLVAGQVAAANNHSIGPTNGSDILGAFIGTTLTGWGSGATCSLLKSQGGSYVVKVIAGSSGVLPNPTVTISLAAGGFNTLTVANCLEVLSGNAFGTINYQSNTAGVQTISLSGTPVASAAYDIYVVG